MIRLAGVYLLNCAFSCAYVLAALSLPPHDPPAEKDDATKAALAKLAGEWAITSWIQNGRDIKELGSTLAFHDSRLTETIDLGEDPRVLQRFVKHVYSVTLDVRSDPSIIHLTSVSHNRTALFRIKDDTLELCYFTDPDEENKDAVPKVFESKKGSNQTLEKYRRLKMKNEAGGHKK